MRLSLPVIAAGAATGIAALVACAPQQPTLVVVDREHSQVGQPEGVDGLKYIVTPTTRISLDARQFDFSESLYPETRPNAVQLVIGQHRQYSADWHPSGLVDLSEQTLVPINESTAFDGLAAGDQAIVAIGEQRVDEETHEIVLKVLWVGLIEVKG